MAEQLTVQDALARAKKALKRGNKALAIQWFTAVLQAEPNHPVARKQIRKLSRAQVTPAPAKPEPAPAEVDSLIREFQAGRLDKVERGARALLEQFPDSAVVMNLLGVALTKQERPLEAVEVLDRAVEVVPGFAEAHDNRGVALKAAGDLDGAVASFDKALAAKPGFATALYNRGNALKDHGHFDRAIESYEEAIRLQPGFAEAHRAVSALKTYEPGDQQLATMQSLADGLTDGLTSRAELFFALAKAYEDLGDLDKSFECVREGNRLVNLRLGYKLQQDADLFDGLRAQFASAKAPAATGESPRPVFIVGMMRSGTSLVEQILASHHDVHGAGELEAMNRLVVPMLDEDGIDLSAIHDGYQAMLKSLDVPEPVITDKMPLNFRWIGHILTSMPSAKIVHVVRNPMATCWSIYKHYFADAGHGYAWDLENLGGYYRLYESLMAFWRERFPDRIFDLDYEALTEDSATETRQLLEFLDLDWDPNCLAFHRTDRPVRTLSATQVRQKIYTGSSEAWRKFEAQLEPLKTALDAR